MAGKVRLEIFEREGQRVLDERQLPAIDEPDPSGPVMLHEHQLELEFDDRGHGRPVIDLRTQDLRQWDPDGHDRPLVVEWVPPTSQARLGAGWHPVRRTRHAVRELRLGLGLRWRQWRLSRSRY